MRVYRMIAYEGPDDQIEQVISHSIKTGTVKDFGRCAVAVVDVEPNAMGWPGTTMPLLQALLDRHELSLTSVADDYEVHQ